MKPLYEIANDYQELLNEIGDAEEITDEQIELLDQCKDDLNIKIINVGAFIRNLEVEQEAIEKAIDNMVERSLRIKNKVEKLREYLKQNMEKFNIRHVKSPHFDVKIRLNPFSVNVEDESLIPSEYIKETILRKISKTLIFQELKNNINIPGACLEQKTRVDIR